MIFWGSGFPTHDSCMWRCPTVPTVLGATGGALTAPSTPKPSPGSCPARGMTSCWMERAGKRGDDGAGVYSRWRTPHYGHGRMNTAKVNEYSRLMINRRRPPLGILPAAVAVVQLVGTHFAAQRFDAPLAWVRGAPAVGRACAVAVAPPGPGPDGCRHRAGDASAMSLPVSPGARSRFPLPWGLSWPCWPGPAGGRGAVRRRRPRLPAAGTAAWGEHSRLLRARVADRHPAGGGAGPQRQGPAGRIPPRGQRTGTGTNATRNAWCWPGTSTTSWHIHCQ